MWFYELLAALTGVFQTNLSNWSDYLFDTLRGSGSSGIFDNNYQVNDNVIGNNSAILLTDDAESTVNFLYVNPIEFFNNGRASDIYLNIDFTDDESTEEAPLSISLFEETGDSEGESLDASDGSQINGNVIGNNAAVLLTDDAQSTVNFLYINPIEFFNNGRASDIYINYNDGDQVAEPVEQEINAQTNVNAEGEAPEELATSDQFFENLLEDGLAEDLFDFSVEILNELGLQDRLSGIFDDLSVPTPPDYFGCDSDLNSPPDVTTDQSNGSNEFNDNLIGNNAAIIATDNAINEVNFIYVNPIQFFNDGRGGDIYLNLSLGSDDGLVLI